MSSKEQIDKSTLNELERYLAEAQRQQAQYYADNPPEKANEQQRTLPPGWRLDNDYPEMVVQFNHYDPNPNSEHKKTERYYGYRNFLVTDHSGNPAEDFCLGSESGIRSSHCRIDVQFLKDTPKSPEVYIKTLFGEVTIITKKGYDVELPIYNDLLIQAGDVVVINPKLAFMVELTYDEPKNRWNIALIRVKKTS